MTFDDVLLVPAYSEILPREVDLATRLTRDIRLNLPLVSAAMDTVTEARLAITMAQEGGIGIVHKNMTIAGQAAEVARVKKFESGVIRDPITVAPDMTIRQVIELTRSKGISGVPVVQGAKVVGIVTHRDLRFEVKLDAPVSTVMTPKERLVTVRENAPKDEVLLLLHKHRIEKVLVVNSNEELRGMITVKDFQKATEFPRACKDPSGRLRVGAAVGTAQDTHRARRGAARGRRRRGRRRHRARPLEGRARHDRAHQGEVGRPAGHRRQRRDGGCRARSRQGRRRRHQGRHRPGLHLHHAHRRGRRRSADLRGVERRGGRRRTRFRSSPTAASASRATSPRPSSLARTA